MAYNSHIVGHFLMKKKDKIPKFNPVAKNAHKFNRAAVFRNKKLDYTRKIKHPKKDEEE